MAVAFSEFSKPLKRLDRTMSSSGTIPTREAGGKTASAADAPCSVRLKPSAATSEPLIVSSEKPVASGLERASHLAQGEIKPPPLRQEIRTAGDQAVDAVIDQAGRAAEDDGVPRAQPDGTCRIAALQAAVSKQRGVAERQGHH